MFGDLTYEENLAEHILKDFCLEEILEMNDLPEHLVLAILIRNGVIDQPERFFDTDDYTE